MVYVRLARDWTDDEGLEHDAGDMVDVDAVTLAQLEADGVVEASDTRETPVLTAWAGETGVKPQWAGETGVKPQWAGETGVKPQWAGETGIEA
ncbi:hypothetical protein HC031_08310 [Planosporangium thailandense]|uniref:Uncharacterized protein n=1 Tax=Planosporangium thailandense TaxID=765197 RepID=A0ABX0XUN5_9ACTN|nr:hypothetical protein [Planosporangium thailandense]NJC69722.1 hypothetical protein [Planosporangium thailandense]